MRVSVGPPLAALGLAVGLAVLPPSGPSQAAMVTRWRVTAAASTAQLTLGQTVKITGHVQRGAAGERVKLQQRYAGSTAWKPTGDATVRSDGTFTLKDTPTRDHRRSYRVVMPADAHHQRGVSPTMALDVYEWLTLTSAFPQVNTSYLYEVSSVGINGTSYPSSLQAVMYDGSPTTQSVEFNLNHECLRFRGRFGLADNSESGSQAEVTASADGTPWFDQTYSLGESSPDLVVFDTPPLKIHFQSQSLTDGAFGLGAIATPQVYCEQ